MVLVVVVVVVMVVWCGVAKISLNGSPGDNLTSLVHHHQIAKWQHSIVQRSSSLR